MDPKWISRVNAAPRYRPGLPSFHPGLSHHKVEMLPPDARKAKKQHWLGTSSWAISLSLETCDEGGRPSPMACAWVDACLLPAHPRQCVVCRI